MKSIDVNYMVSQENLFKGWSGTEWDILRFPFFHLPFFDSQLIELVEGIKIK